MYAVMIISLLGIIDIIAGILIGLGLVVDFTGNNIIFTLGIIMVIKGLYSTLTAMAGGFFFDVLGWIDLTSGIFLFILFFGMTFGFFFYLAIIIVLKGIYSFFVGLSG